MANDLIQHIIGHRLHIDSDLEEFSNYIVNTEGYIKVASETKFLMKKVGMIHLLSLYVGIKTNSRKENYNSKEKAVIGK